MAGTHALCLSCVALRLSASNDPRSGNLPSSTPEGSPVPSSENTRVRSNFTSGHPKSHPGQEVQASALKSRDVVPAQGKHPEDVGPHPQAFWLHAWGGGSHRTASLVLQLPDSLQEILPYLEPVWIFANQDPHIVHRSPLSFATRISVAASLGPPPSSAQIPAFFLLRACCVRTGVQPSTAHSQCPCVPSLAPCLMVAG